MPKLDSFRYYFLLCGAGVRGSQGRRGEDTCRRGCLPREEEDPSQSKALCYSPVGAPFTGFHLNLRGRLIRPTFGVKRPTFGVLFLKGSPGSPDSPIAGDQPLPPSPVVLSSCFPLCECNVLLSCGRRRPDDGERRAEPWRGQGRRLHVLPAAGRATVRSDRHGVHLAAPRQRDEPVDHEPVDGV